MKSVYFHEIDAAVAWADEYRGQSEKYEYAVFLYSKQDNGSKVYYTGQTYKGMSSHGPISPNVIIPFIYLYLVEALLQWFRHGARVAAMLHTHPSPPAGYTYRSHSNGDLFLLKLPGIKAVYVVPFENNEIIRKPK